MSRVSRGTPDGDAYLDLKNRAQREKRPTQELLQLYVLEAFLGRLAASDFRDYLAAAEAAGEVVEITSRTELLTPAQAAARLGISRATVARRITSGDLHAIKVGSHRKIPLREYERFRDARAAELICATSEDIEVDLRGSASRG